MNPTNRPTWDNRTTPGNQAEILRRMRASGLPLFSVENEEEESDKSKITAVISIVAEQVDAYVATPSGMVYRFTPSSLEVEWWSFALRNYYVVTGNLADREWLIAKTAVEKSQVKGKCISRAKGAALSELSLSDLFDKACPHAQGNLFNE